MDLKTQAESEPQIFFHGNLRGYEVYIDSGWKTVVENAIKCVKRASVREVWIYFLENRTWASHTPTTICVKEK